MEYKQDTQISFRNFAEQTLQSAPQKSLTAYALESVMSVMRREDASALDTNLLRLWLAEMIIGGKKTSTCKRYFGRLHTLSNNTLYNTTGEDVFADVLPLFDSLSEANAAEAQQNLGYVKRLLAKNEQSSLWQTVCIFFYLLYNPAASIQDVINLTFEDAPNFCAQIDDIVNSFDSSHGRKYVFALKQGKSRPHEIERNLTADLQSLLSSVGMTFTGGFSRASITSLWIAAAIKSGVAFSDIRACIGAVPPAYAALAIVEKSRLTEMDREDIICMVADSINSFAARWYVMKLRQGVTVDAVKQAISDKLPGRLSTMTFFYPTRIEVRKEGKKRIEEEIPYLPNILFFKIQSHRVKSLFAAIGDLAWCFKTSNSPDSDYAVISHAQMAVFQQCIGRFTSDIKMELTDGRPLPEKGRKVRITGGIMAGYEGEILDIADEPGARIFFLSISDNHLARWTAHVEDIYIEVIGER